MNNIFILFNIICILYCLYDTDFFPEYAKLFRCKFLKYEEYFKSLNSPIKLNYFEFISYKYPNFLTKLLSCPTCISVWLCILSLFLCNSSWTNLGFELIFVWVGYAGLRKILKKLYE